jgi:hypothetical protein
VKDDVNKLLELPTDEEIKDCFRKFRSVTSNKGLREGICVVCARECIDDGMEKSRLLNDPSIRALLVPSQHHPAQVLWHVALVLGNEVEEVEDGYCTFICIECATALQRAKLPLFALVNDLWLGVIKEGSVTGEVSERWFYHTEELDRLVKPM